MINFHQLWRGATIFVMYQRTGLLGWSEWKKGSEVSVGGPGTFYGARMCHSTGVPSM